MLVFSSDRRVAAAVNIQHIPTADFNQEMRYYMESLKYYFIVYFPWVAEKKYTHKYKL